MWSLSSISIGSSLNFELRSKRHSTLCVQLWIMFSLCSIVEGNNSLAQSTYVSYMHMCIYLACTTALQSALASSFNYYIGFLLFTFHELIYNFVHSFVNTSSTHACTCINMLCSTTFDKTLQSVIVLWALCNHLEENEVYNFFYSNNSLPYSFL